MFNKIFTLFLLCALVGALAFVQCTCSEDDNPASSGGQQVTESELVGKWVVTDSYADVYVTVDSSQTVCHLDQPGTGGITVSGDYSQTLQYLMAVNLWGVRYLGVSNQSFIQNYSYPRYMLGIVNYGTVAGIQFKIFTSDTDSVVYNAPTFTTADYSYDSTTFTLTLQSPIILEQQNNTARTVTVRGALTANVTQLEDSVHTKVLSNIDYVDTGTSIFYRADSTYCIVDAGAADTASRGTWTLTDNRLTMIQQTPVRDTTAYTPTLLGANRLNAVVDEEYCDARNQTNCYGILELQLGLASGSIDTASLRGTVVLDRR